MLLQNLMAVLGTRYNYGLYANLIREVRDTVQGGIPMHYNLPNINAYQGDVYRGYTDVTKWRGWVSTTATWRRLPSTPSAGVEHGP